jgi:hypothetical protein
MKPFLDAINHSLPMAFGIAASPSPIIAIMILMMTSRAKSNAITFLIGWISGLMLVGLIVIFLPGLLGGAFKSSHNTGFIRIILGSFFLILSFFVARQIPPKGQKAAPPRWLEKLDSFSFRESFAFGFFFSVPNIKNASLVVAGMTTVVNQELDMGQKVIISILFCLVASLGVLIPPGIYLLFQTKAEHLFGTLKRWLISKRALILFLILIIFGVLWIYQGYLMLKHY